MKIHMDPHFQDLLFEYAQASTEMERSRLEAQLWQEFGALHAIFVMDMSGFSRMTQRYGIVHYLAMVRRMQLTSQPIIEQYGGAVIKYEADNCYAVFTDSLSAVRAGIALKAAFFGINIITPDDADIQVSIGIDYGNILMVDGPDYFGDPVNLACKLGEDLAGPGEILLTGRAFEQIPAEAGLGGTALHFSISGIELNAFLVTE